MSELTPKEVARDRDLKAWAAQDLLQQALELANMDRPNRDPEYYLNNVPGLRRLLKETRNRDRLELREKIFNDKNLKVDILEVLNENYILRPDGQTEKDCMAHDLLVVFGSYVHYQILALFKSHISETTYCPDCITFGQDCSVDPEEYMEPCEFFKRREEEVSP